MCRQFSRVHMYFPCLLLPILQIICDYLLSTSLDVKGIGVWELMSFSLHSRIKKTIFRFRERSLDKREKQQMKKVEQN